jgi:protein-tyrosine-phosphatase
MLKPKVLFLCTGNSARSQMAEAFLRDMAGDRFEALSAGITPRGLHPLAVEVMREIGIDISQQQSKDVREFLGTPFHTLLPSATTRRSTARFSRARTNSTGALRIRQRLRERRIKNPRCSGVFGMRLPAALSASSQARHKQLD